MDRVQNDEKFLLELIRDFDRDFRKKRKMIELAVQESDFAKIQGLIHSVKGAAGNISAKPIHTSCMLIEYLVTCQDIGLIKDVLSQIDQQFLELQAYSTGKKRIL